MVECLRLHDRDLHKDQTSAPLRPLTFLRSYAKRGWATEALVMISTGRHVVKHANGIKDSGQ